MAQPLTSFALPTSGVKTVIPEIANGTWVQVKFTGVDEKNMVENGETEKAEGKPQLNFKFELTKPAQGSKMDSKTGAPEVIEPGKPGAYLSERIFLRDKNNLTSIPDRAGRDIAKIQDALDNTGDPDNEEGKPARSNFDPQWIAASINKTCMAHVIIDGQYGNKIKEFKSNSDPMFQVAIQ